MAFDKNNLEEVNVNLLIDNDERMEYIQAAVNRQRDLVRIYTEETIMFRGLEFVPVATVTEIKQMFVALRTRVKAAEDLITG
jgi:hypothetical protein